MNDAVEVRSLDFLDLNGGRPPADPNSHPMSSLEVVVCPEVQIGQLEHDPASALVRIHHPRLGWLNFLFPAKVRGPISQALAPVSPLMDSTPKSPLALSPGFDVT